ncbi:MAG: hypothetical protein K2Q25_05040, partial [Mycobacteriaceae bacterium]|nr:hypothetical protein [Mycobacteriaceae bacterium]
MPSQSYLPVFASIVCLTGAVAEASLIGQATANGVLKENTWIIAGQACEAMFDASDATLLYVYISDELNTYVHSGPGNQYRIVGTLN